MDDNGNRYQNNYTRYNQNTEPNIKIKGNKKSLINKKNLTTPALERASSVPSSHTRNNTSSLSIDETNKHPKKPYALNVRKHDVITHQIRIKIKYNNSTTPQKDGLINADNHSIIETKNVTKELKTIADIPGDNIYHRYSYKYNPNISNIGSYSIDETNKKPKKEIVLAPRKNEVIISTKPKKRTVSKSPIQINLRKKLNLNQPDKNYTYEPKVKNEKKININKYEPKLSKDKYEPKVNRDKYEPKINMDKYEIKVNKNKYEPKPSKGKYEPKISKDKYEPKSSKGKYEPKIIKEKYEPKVSKDKYKPKINKYKYEPKTSKDKYESKTSKDKYEPKINKNKYEPKINKNKYEPKVNYKSETRKKNYTYEPLNLKKRDEQPNILINKSKDDSNRYVPQNNFLIYDSQYIKKKPVSIL